MNKAQECRYWHGNYLIERIVNRKQYMRLLIELGEHPSVINLIKEDIKKLEGELEKI
jgi:hypothetical protein